MGTGATRASEAIFRLQEIIIGKRSSSHSFEIAAKLKGEKGVGMQTLGQ